jgi:hypothetical protein
MKNMNIKNYLSYLLILVLLLSVSLNFVNADENNESIIINEENTNEMNNDEIVVDETISEKLLGISPLIVTPLYPQPNTQINITSSMIWLAYNLSTPSGMTVDPADVFCWANFTQYITEEGGYDDELGYLPIGNYSKIVYANLSNIVEINETPVTRVIHAQVVPWSLELGPCWVCDEQAAIDSSATACADPEYIYYGEKVCWKPFSSTSTYGWNMTCTYNGTLVYTAQGEGMNKNPEVLTIPVVSDITTSSAKISWTMDEDTHNHVTFELNKYYDMPNAQIINESSPYFNLTKYKYIFDGSGKTANAVVDLSNLPSATQINYTTIGCNEVGEEHFSKMHYPSVDCGVYTGTFTTATVPSGSSGSSSSSNTNYCEEEWTCTEWSTCNAGEKNRDCTEVSDCGTTYDKPAERDVCFIIEEEIEEDLEEKSEEMVDANVDTSNLGGSTEETLEQEGSSNLITGAVVGGAGKGAVWLWSFVGLAIIGAIVANVYYFRKRN